MCRAERDPERGRSVAAKLKALGVKGILINAAEQGYITQLACKMPECFCPEELGGACYFEPAATKSDWTPTHEHFPRSKRKGGHRTVDNAVLAHRLCNRIDYSISVGRPYARDLERVRKAREEASTSEAQLEQLIGRAKRLGTKYYEATGRPLGVTSEIGEYEAARLLGLTLAPVRQTGYDAIRKSRKGGQRFQIKARCVLPTSKRGQRLGSISLLKEWDAVLLVLMDKHFEVTAIHEADRTAVTEALMKPGSKSRNERGALSVNQFVAIGTQVWPVAARKRRRYS
jgi:hypothetical protein